MKVKKVLVSAFLLATCLMNVQAQRRNEIQVPDLDGYTTLKCDFHMHTVFSDGLVWPTVRVDEAYREGLDAISLTEHSEDVYKRQGEMSVPGIMCQDATTIRMAFIMPETKSIRSIISVSYTHLPTRFTFFAVP